MAVDMTLKMAWSASGSTLYLLYYTKRPYDLYKETKSFDLSCLESEEDVKNIAYWLNCYATHRYEWERLINYWQPKRARYDTAVNLDINDLWRALSAESFYLEALLLG